MNDNNRRYVVGWQSPTGVTGHGETIGRRTAHAWAKYANAVQPEILHRVYYLDADGVTPVSYTHLDVYKRQIRR